MKKTSKKQKQYLLKRQKMFNQRWNMHQLQNPYNPLTDKHTIYYRDGITFDQTLINQKQKQINNIKNNIKLLSQLKSNKSPHQSINRQLLSHFSLSKDHQKSISSVGQSRTHKKIYNSSVQNSNTKLPCIDSAENPSIQKRKKKKKNKTKSLSKKIILDLQF